jgi:predicted ATPase/DNA-binding SARP family transcriptional activator
MAVDSITRKDPLSSVHPGLPVELTSFIGREREIVELRQLLGTSRLLTLTGAGGSGKTRLALEVVQELSDVVWVELAALRDGSLVAQHIAAACGISEEMRGGESAVLIRLLRDRALLLVLDNCEHLVETCAELADQLLRACPDLSILATSREALGVKGERAWLVPALGVPEATSATRAAAESSEAVRLFVERAREIAGEFELTDQNAAVVAEICRRLDGIPLAIELAAARVKLLTPNQLRDRLDDAFKLLKSPLRSGAPRHRTLTAAIDWSYDLLLEEEQQLFQRLSSFRGGFTLEAAEAIGATDTSEQSDVVALLSRLVDRSLVFVREHGGAARYGMLETVQQYARQRLQESGEEPLVRRKHAEHFEQVIAEAEPHLIRPERRVWTDLLMPDLDNFREALAWSRAEDGALHVRLVGLLWWFWFSTAHWTEARTWSDEALALPAAAEPGRPRAKLLYAAGALAALQVRPDARAPLEESARLASQYGDPQVEAYALAYMGMAYAGDGKAEAKALCARAAEWFEANGDLFGLRQTFLVRATLASTLGEFDEAERLAQRGVEIARRFGQDREISISLQILALVQLARKDFERAEHLLLESLAAARRDLSFFSLANGLDFLAEVVGHRGRPLEAARILGASENVRSMIGATAFGVHRERLAAALPGFKAEAGEHAFDQAWSVGRQMSADAILDVLLAAAAVPTSPAVAPTTKPVELRVQALGRLQVEVDGRPLAGETWSYAKPKELLVYLLCQQQGATRDQIGKALWPTATPAQLKNSFHVTVHHLRKALGHPEWILLEADRYRIAPKLRYEFDADRFEAEARAALKTPSVGQLRSVLKLYRGDLLEGEVVGAWHEERRDLLRRFQVDLSLALGHALEVTGLADEAAAIYQQITSRDDLQEEAHRRLMAIWARTGERSRALRHYQRFVTVLRDALDAEPEPETSLLYERIRAAGSA